VSLNTAAATKVCRARSLLPTAVQSPNFPKFNYFFCRRVYECSKFLEDPDFLSINTPCSATG